MACSSTDFMIPRLFGDKDVEKENKETERERVSKVGKNIGISDTKNTR